MKLKIEIDLSSEVFLGCDRNIYGTEVRRILLKYSEKISKGIKFIGPDSNAPMVDLNGNKVGDWKLTD